MKATRRQADEAVKMLAAACGKVSGFGVGQWFLDYNSTYGGAVISEKLEGGGERNPLGGVRMPLGPFCMACGMASRAAYQARIDTELELAR